MIQCAGCHKNIIDFTEDGTPRMRSKIVLFTENGAEAKCPSCGDMVPVPLTLNAPIKKPTNPLKHYIRADL